MLARPLLRWNGMFAHLLVPIDLSERNARCLELATALPAKRVTVLHVIHRVPGLPAGELRPFYARLRRRAEAVLARATASLARAGVRAMRVTTVGDPAGEILRVAAARRVDLIVIGSHRLAPRPGQGLGTTSYKVALAAPCPVLLVK